jgi:1-deoxyxylulose-5-phosphate synthase
MRQNVLGRTGLSVSEICLGTMTFAGQSDEAASLQILDKAADLGMTFLDTADIYPIPPDPDTAGRTEEVIGRWLAKRTDRDRFTIATKCRMRVGHGPNDEGLSRRHIHRACEASLRRLGVDCIDLYQTHSPDYNTPLDETLRALDDLVRWGKVRTIGCSNEPAWRLARAIGRSEFHDWTRFEAVQPRYNILHRSIEAELLPLCRAEGVGVIVYNPLAGGMLSGKYGNPEDPPPPNTRFSLGASGKLYRERYWQAAQFEAVAALNRVCVERGLNLTTAAVAWVLAQPGITSAIVGASRPDQLDATFAAQDVKLDDETLSAFDAVWWSLPRRPKD